GGESRFYLFHRRRVWSASEGCWMGWERKRGKLNELNRLLRGAADTTFLPTPSPPPEGVRYVITLDADTQLPRGAAARLVGTLAHPLNRARLDPRERRVVEGYGILQPRIAPTLPSDRESSIYQRISSGPAGLDPYASAVSDVYQDLFGEGSYTGKGIYDIDAFESALAGRVPEAALLSHDLFEGLFARAGLVSDIDLFEEFPARYEVGAGRLAAAAVDRAGGGGQGRHPGAHRSHRPVEDVRQSAPDALRARGLPHLARRLDLPRRRRHGVDQVRPARHRHSGVHSGIDGDLAAAGRRLQARLCAGIGPKPHAGHRPGHLDPGPARPPGMADGGRDGPDARAPALHPAP